MENTQADSGQEFGSENQEPKASFPRVFVATANFVLASHLPKRKENIA